MLYSPQNERIETINDSNFEDYLAPIIDGQLKSMGLRPRSFAAHPPGYLEVAPVFSDVDVYPENEWESRLRDQVQAQTDLFLMRDLYYEILQSLDQDGYGYCWAFSSVKALMYALRKMNNPKLRLSAWMVASIIKNYRDQGGWGQESVEFLAKFGCATLDEWAQGEAGPQARRLDTPEMRNAAIKRRVTEWWDGTESREQNKRIMVTAFLMGLAPVLDFNWWSHSVCGLRLVSINPLVIDIDNSWSPTAGTKGVYRLEGAKAIPDNIVIPRVAMAA